MDALQYADEIVDPTIAEFEADPLSTRRALLACVVTFHMIDYGTHRAGSRARREAFRRESPAFAMIDRVAHALKYVTTGDLRHPTNKTLASDQVIARPPALAGRSLAGLSRAGALTIAGEHNINLLADVKEAAAFLRSEAVVKGGY